MKALKIQFDAQILHIFLMGKPLLVDFFRVGLGSIPTDRKMLATSNGFFSWAHEMVHWLSDR